MTVSVITSRDLFQRDDHAIPYFYRNRAKITADAGSADAIAVFDAELGAVQAALDQGAAVIQKLVGLPFHRRAGVRATVAVSINAIGGANHQNIGVESIRVGGKAFAGAFGE